MIGPQNKYYWLMTALAIVALIAALTGLIVSVVYFPDGLLHRA